MSRRKEERRWMSRRDVANALGYSISHVRRLEQPSSKGGPRLNPKRETLPGGKIRVRFDPEEVDRLRAEAAERRKDREQRASKRGWTVRDGEVAARAFELFRAGADKAEVVIQCRLTPEAVTELWIQYCTTLRDEARQREDAKRVKEIRAAAREEAKERARQDKQARDARAKRMARRAQPVTIGLTDEQLIEPGEAP
jgi:hypothetical protein